MKIIQLMISGVLLALLPTVAVAAAWEIDPDHSSVGFKVRHLMVSNVTGVFGKVAGTVKIDEQDITRSSVSVSVETASINTGIAKRDDHLRSGDFLEVGKYPVMTFVSRNVVKSGAGRLKVVGDLTLHGVTKELVLDVDGPSQAVRDPWGKTRSGASATAKLNRKDFGLTWNKALETGGVVVGEEVQIHLEVEMVKQ